MIALFKEGESLWCHEIGGRLNLKTCACRAFLNNGIARSMSGPVLFLKDITETEARATLVEQKFEDEAARER